MKQTITICEICGKKAENEEQLRKENWIRIKGGMFKGIEIWLNKPRKKDGSYMHHVGWRDREYDFFPHRKRWSCISRTDYEPLLLLKKRPWHLRERTAGQRWEHNRNLPSASPL